jgi:hypothetical protein
MVPRKSQISPPVARVSWTKENPDGGNQLEQLPGESTDRRRECVNRTHQTLRVTSEMEAGIADHVWAIEEIVALIG